MRIAASLLLSVFILSSAGALAESPPKPSDENPCSGDIKKYCSDVVPGEGRLARCMKKHAAQLSSGCKQYGKQYEKEHPEVAKELNPQNKSGG